MTKECQWRASLLIDALFIFSELNPANVLTLGKYDDVHQDLCEAHRSFQSRSRFCRMYFHPAACSHLNTCSISNMSHHKPCALSGKNIQSQTRSGPILWWFVFGAWVLRYSFHLALFDVLQFFRCELATGFSFVALSAKCCSLSHIAHLKWMITLLSTPMRVHGQVKSTPSDWSCYLFRCISILPLMRHLS